MRRRRNRLALLAVSALVAVVPAAHVGDPAEPADEPRDLLDLAFAQLPPPPVVRAARPITVEPGPDMATLPVVQGPTTTIAAEPPASPGDAVIAPPPERFDAPPAPPAPPPAPLREDAYANARPEGGVWAVVIGVNDYPGSRSDLRSAVNDARDMVEALTRFGVPGHRILLVEDRQASAATIRAAMDWLVAHASPEATAVFFYAGHVRKLGDRSEAMVAADGRLVTDHEAGERLRGLAARHVWVTMAACYGGGFTELLGPGRILTAAANANSLAYENASFGRSYLVQYMVRMAMIEGRAASSVQAAYDWAYEALARDYPRRLPFQIDQSGGRLTIGDGSPDPAPPRPHEAPSQPPSGTGGGGQGGGGGGSHSSHPPEERDQEGCSGIRLGSLVDCSPDD